MGVGLSRPLGESPLQAWPDSNVFHWAMRLSVVFCLMTAHVLAGDTAEEARRLLAGVREARGALRRGVYQADGDVNLNGGLAGPIRDRVAIFCAFDFDKALFRIDRTAPLVLTDPSSGEREIRTVATSYVKTPQGIRYWDDSQGTSDSGSVSLYPQDWRPPENAKWLDVRTFGMCGWASVENCVGFDEAMDALDEYRVIEVEKSATGQSVVTFLHGPKEDMKTSLWIDEQKGFTIGREEFRGLHLATGEWTDVVSSTEMDWDERSGVFVPKRLVVERHFNGHESYSLALEWSAVNEPVDERLFEIEGLNLTAGTPIFDQRRGEKPVVLGRVRDTSNQPLDAAPAADQPPPTRSWLVATNFALVAIIVAALWFVRRRRRRKS